MSAEQNRPGNEQQTTDDDLLADAIPIDEVADEEEEELEPIEDSDEEDLEAIDLAEEAPEAPKKQIRTFGTHRSHAEDWARTPNTPGTGAIHVRTFVSKLRLDAIENMDQQINEWLDSHPEYEVKFISSVVGELTGKTKEPAVFMSVWV